MLLKRELIKLRCWFTIFIQDRAGRDMIHDTVQYDTIHNTVVWYGTIQHYMIRCMICTHDTVCYNTPYSMVHDKVRDDMIRDTVLYSTVQYDTIHNAAWHGTIRCTVWCTWWHQMAWKQVVEQKWHLLFVCVACVLFIFCFLLPCRHISCCSSMVECPYWSAEVTSPITTRVDTKLVISSWRAALWFISKRIKLVVLHFTLTGHSESWTLGF